MLALLRDGPRTTAQNCEALGDDHGPLASLGKLQRLYLEGTSIPAEQREQLSATIPGLAIDP